MVKGVNGQVKVKDGHVIITRKGLLGLWSRHAETKIPIERISFVQLKKSTHTNGFINFVMAGSPQINTVQEARKGPTSVIVNPFQYKKFAKLKAEVESLMLSKTASVTNNDMVGTLEKLAELKEKGIITKEEFENKKQEVLSRV